MLHNYRLIRQRALMGEKDISIDGRDYHLPGYYPALLTPVEWAELQALAGTRGRRSPTGPVPGMLTGMRVTRCGYCGAAMVGQNIGTRKRREDGGIQDGHRRLHCTSYNAGGCPVPGSCSVAPIERAIMRWCSDLVNLRSLYDGADDAWRALADGVEAQDEDARIRARQLVADTFERIVVYHHGMVPTETPPGTIDLVLLAKGGTARQLRINRTGTVLAAEQAAAV